ncbi:MAG: ABC transporter substrate-binding protein [candidate division Zixibacteria bacterium]|nr:ABC transporter substrate-binding protein [candidate division Zixibacteria bacterium]
MPSTNQYHAMTSAEQLVSAPRRFRRNGHRRAYPVIGMVVCVLILASSVWAAVPGGRALKTRDKVLRERFEAAVDLYVDGTYTIAEREFRDIASSPQLSRRGQEVAHFMVGKCQFASEAYGVCRNFFAYYVDTYPKSPYLAAAHIMIGHCAFRLGDDVTAANAYVAALGVRDEDYAPIARRNLEPLITWSLSQTELEILLTSLDESPEYDWVRLWIADRWSAQGRERLANDIYAEIAARHPSSEPAQLASARLGGGATAAEPTEQLVIGVLGPMSGDFQDFGYDMVRGAQLAADRFPMGVTIEVFDTQADSARAVMMVDSVASRRCDCVIGPLHSAAILGTAPLFDDEGIPQVLPLARRGGYSESYDRLFQMSRPPAEQAQRLAEYAIHTLHLNQLSALVSDTPEGRAAGAAFADVAEWAGRAMHPVQYFNPGDTDFGEQLKTLRRRTLPPDLTKEQREDTLSLMEGMLVWGDAEDIVLIAPQMVFHGFRVYAFGPEGWSDKDGLRRMRKSLDSTIFVSYEWVDESRPEWTMFVREFETEWSYTPTTLSGRVYDVVSWLGDGTGRDPQARQIVRTLARESGYRGATREWRFDEDGYPTHIPVLHYVNRRIVPVEAN